MHRKFDVAKRADIVVKRVSEMMSISGTAAARRGYTATDVPILQLMGIASGFTQKM